MKERTDILENDWKNLQLNSEWIEAKLSESILLIRDDEFKQW